MSISIPPAFTINSLGPLLDRTKYILLARAEKMQVLSFLYLWLLHLSVALPVEDFYPFGTETTDKLLSKGNNESVQLLATFLFFGVNQSQTTVFVSI